MDALLSAQTVDALALTVPTLPVEKDQDAGGEPTAGWVALPGLPGIDVGVWEMSAGAMLDVEADEVFVVIAGAATVEVLDVSGLVTDRVELRPGVVCRLDAGMRTRWNVRRTLRKVYVAPADGS